jgi:hypothetical protein
MPLQVQLWQAAVEMYVSTPTTERRRTQKLGPIIEEAFEDYLVYQIVDWLTSKG